MTKTHRTPALPRIPGVNLRHVRHHRGYAVGDDGSVWSCRRIGGGPLMGCWRRLTPVADPQGYLSVRMDGRRIGVHRVVLRAFAGRCPVGMQARHLDGNPENNRADNLRWGTRRENQADRVRHGTHQFGERNPNAKLTQRHAELTRELASLGVPRAAIAELLGCAVSTVGAIVRAETWTNAA